MRLLFAIAILFAFECVSSGQELARKHRVESQLLDEANHPLANVPLYVDLSTRSPDPDKCYWLESDSEGRFVVEGETSDPYGLVVYVVADGKQIDFVASTIIVPQRIRLRNETSFKVQIVDTKGNSIRNATVLPSIIRFPTEEMKLPQEFAKRRGTTTDEDGLAVLHGVSNSMFAISVEFDGVVCDFDLPSREIDDESIPCCVWPTRFGEVRYRLLDANGVPIEGHAVSANSAPGESNPNRTNTPLPGYNRTLKTDSRGECIFKSVPCPIVLQGEFSNTRGIDIRKTIDVVPGSVYKEEFQAPSTVRVPFHLVNGSEPGITDSFKGQPVYFAKDNRTYATIATGTTDEDGVGEIILEEGDWHVINMQDLPQGFIQFNSGFQVAFKVNLQSVNPPPVITLVQGRELQFELLPSDKIDRLYYLMADVKLPLDNETSFFAKMVSHKKFVVSIPEDTKDSDVKFRAFVSIPQPGKEDMLGWKDLKVISLEPLRLRLDN